MQLKKEKSYEKQDGKKEGHTREIHRFAASQAARGGRSTETKYGL